MTDKEILFQYRLKEAEETIDDAERMLKDKFNHRSVINRTYYSMFYALLALFIKTDINIKTSKHTGIISIFDKNFVHTGKFDKSYSMLIHKVFNARLKSDYKELVEFTEDEVIKYINYAKKFISAIKQYNN